MSAFQKVYYIENGLQVSRLIKILEDYINHNIRVFDIDGVIIHYSEDFDIVNLEAVFFDYQGWDTIEDYDLFLNESKIYNTISVKDFIETIKEYSDKPITVCGEDVYFIFIDDNNVCFAFGCSEWAYDELVKMDNNCDSEYIKVASKANIE